MHEDRTTEQTPAQRIAAELSAEDCRSMQRSVSPDVLMTAAAYVSHNWGGYGYSVALEAGGFGWGLFRGHHSDGSDFWFVVDRYCNVADVAVER